MPRTMQHQHADAAAHDGHRRGVFSTGTACESTPLSGCGHGWGDGFEGSGQDSSNDQLGRIASMPMSKLEPEKWVRSTLKGWVWSTLG